MVKKTDVTILKTFRVNLVGYMLKRYCLHYLYDEVLHKDPNWHFFLDEGGITLRFSPKHEKQVKKLLGGDNKSYTVEKDYDGAVDEYEGIRYMARDLLPLFNAISVLSVKYPPKVMTGTVMERMNHTLFNQTGDHSFYNEAMAYAKLAVGRAEIGGSVGRGSAKP